MLLRMMRIRWRHWRARRAQRRVRRRALRAGADALQPLGDGYARPDCQRFAIDGPSGRYDLFVAIPQAPPPPAGYGVLYVLDGGAIAGAAVDALRLQAPWPEVSGVAPVLVVGIGYPGEQGFDHDRRALDFTPVPSGSARAAAMSLGGPWVKVGGADAFLDFMVGPLETALRRRYPIDPSQRSLCGLSLGGVCVARALLRAPARFRHHVAVSTAFWWDGTHMVEALASLDPAAARGVSLLVVVGSEEIPGNAAISTMMVRDSRAAVDNAAARGVRAACVELDGENHQSTIIAAMPRIMRWISSPP